ncbi:hypothetical protein B6J58_15230 [Klebsiella quasipneumoniae]|nr:hypothetical protein BME69_22190 [Klebsiella quasipneumoniae subsp. quasipneumoniae]PLC72415.1 hypothetical protein B6I39_11830 [Klebsiella quasipneumoniae]PLJ03738.1 hypothetical protein B6J58_15230 [Klebsiella quasipneumoniae]
MPAVLARRRCACAGLLAVRPGQVGRVRRSRHPAQNRLRARCPCPAALRLRGPTGSQTRTGRPGKAQPPPGTKSAHVLHASAEAFFTSVWQT